MPDKPLQGVRVLDFSELAPGPFMTQCLVEMGAEIVKIERPPRGDSARSMQPGGFKALNQGKTSRFVDLKDDAHVEDILKQIGGFDMVVEGYRPGVMARLGLDYARLSEINPALVYVSISGYGQAGPMADHPGHDINYVAASGVMALTGGFGRPPVDAMGIPVGDFCSALYALSSSLAALLQARQSGRGQWLDVSMVDCLTHWMNSRLGHFHDAGVSTLEAQRDSVFNKPGYGIYQTADGQSIAIGALEQHFWERLISALELDATGLGSCGWQERLARAEEINQLLGQAVGARDADAVLLVLAAADVPASKVVTPNDLPHTPHSISRELFTSVEGQPFVLFPVKMSGGVGRTL